MTDSSFQIIILLTIQLCYNETKSNGFNEQIKMVQNSSF